MLLIGVMITAALLLLGYAQDLRRLRAAPQLDRPEPARADAPLISLLIPARDEERAIGRAVAAALAQGHSQLEVIVVDDGSVDQTPQILAGFDDPRLRILVGRPLPPGWAGKCNACQQLAEAARGEWLLFLDADTAAAPALAGALLAHAERRGLDMLTLFPLLELGSFWERLVLPPFLALITALYPVERMLRPNARPADVIANGQCIFVRRTAYLAIGGHGAVRAEVLEDVRLAQALRAAGYRLGAASGIEALRVRMYTSGREVRAGLTKNAAAGYRSGGLRSLWAVTRLLGLAFGPLWLLGIGLVLPSPPALALGALTLGSGLAFWATLYRALYRQSGAYALLWQLGLLCYLLIALDGMWRVWRGRGVVWKGRTYEG